MRDAFAGGHAEQVRVGVHVPRRAALALMAIDAPLPPLATRHAVDRLQSEVADLRDKHTAIREGNASLLPATVERVFAQRTVKIESVRSTPTGPTNRQCLISSGRIEPRSG